MKSFIYNTLLVTALLFFSEVNAQNAISPCRAHGLEVASVLAMATNNNVGMSAIGYNTGLMVFASGVSNRLSASLDHNADIVEEAGEEAVLIKLLSS